MVTNYFETEQVKNMSIVGDFLADYKTGVGALFLDSHDFDLEWGFLFEAAVDNEEYLGACMAADDGDMTEAEMDELVDEKLGGWMTEVLYQRCKNYGFHGNTPAEVIGNFVANYKEGIGALFGFDPCFELEHNDLYMAATDNDEWNMMFYEVEEEKTKTEADLDALVDAKIGEWMTDLVKERCELVANRT